MWICVKESKVVLLSDGVALTVEYLRQEFLWYFFVARVFIRSIPGFYAMSNRRFPEYGRYSPGGVAYFFHTLPEFLTRQIIRQRQGRSLPYGRVPNSFRLRLSVRHERAFSGEMFPSGSDSPLSSRCPRPRDRRAAAVPDTIHPLLQQRSRQPGLQG